MFFGSTGIFFSWARVVCPCPAQHSRNPEMYPLKFLRGFLVFVVSVAILFLLPYGEETDEVHQPGSKGSEHRNWCKTSTLCHFEFLWKAVLIHKTTTLSVGAVRDLFPFAELCRSMTYYFEFCFGGLSLVGMIVHEVMTSSGSRAGSTPIQIQLLLTVSAFAFQRSEAIYSTFLSVPLKVAIF